MRGRAGGRTEAERCDRLARSTATMSKVGAGRRGVGTDVHGCYPSRRRRPARADGSRAASVARGWRDGWEWDQGEWLAAKERASVADRFVSFWARVIVGQG